MRIVADLNEEISNLNEQVEHISMNMQEIERELNVTRSKLEREKRNHSRTQSAKDVARVRLSRLEAGLCHAKVDKLVYE